MVSQIYLASTDYSRLRALASAIPGRSAAKLSDELDRATVMEPQHLPRGVVRLGSEVTIRDLDTGELESYTLCLPDRADPAHGRLSVLAPIGTALIGYSEGDNLQWETPGGIRRLEITRVVTPE